LGKQETASQGRPESRAQHALQTLHEQNQGDADDPQEQAEHRDLLSAIRRETKPPAEALRAALNNKGKR
jgi:hypothetical protein